MVAITIEQHIKDLQRALREHGGDSTQEFTLYEPISQVLNYLCIITRTDERFLTVAPQYRVHREFEDGTPFFSAFLI